MKLEELQTSTRVRGLTPDGAVTVKSVQWFGDQGVEVIFQDEKGQLHRQLVYRDRTPGDGVKADQAFACLRRFSFRASHSSTIASSPILGSERQKKTA